MKLVEIGREASNMYELILGADVSRFMNFQLPSLEVILAAF